MILYQVHHMWYETSMIDECWHSVLGAIKAAPGVDVKIKICFNFQTYIEEPDVSDVRMLLEKHQNHPLFKDYDVDDVSDKISIIIVSYIDYINNNVWKKNVKTF